MEWGISVTIGFNAQDDPFMNNEYISYEIACSNMPDSNIVNVIYRLSENNPEYVLPRKKFWAIIFAIQCKKFNYV